MAIKLLSDILISRIAAGEVIERPASVVKELVENSIDAGALNVNITIQNGGRNLIKIQDDGCGIEKDELQLAVTRHATSKITGNNLLDIKTLGFRGEGLASIASMSKLKLISRYKNNDKAYQVNVEGGVSGDILEDNLSAGTIITVRDLFYATPARLKFLKTEKTESNYIIEILKKIAIAHPDVAISLDSDGKNIFSYEATNLEKRIYQIMGREFENNSLNLAYKYEDYEISGYVSLPTFNRANSNQEFFFVNSRPIRDKVLLNAVKVAYQDYLAGNRYPVCVIFVKLPFTEVDVNVHPTKAEIRFRDSTKIRNMLITALKEALKTGGFKSSTETEIQAINMIEKNRINKEPVNTSYKQPSFTSFAQPSFNKERPSLSQTQMAIAAAAPLKQTEEIEIQEEDINHPLGAAVAQLHNTYIVSQTKNGLIIVDQHAAHERLVYENLKKALDNKEVKTQKHLFSEIVELEETTLESLLNYQEKLKEYGILIEKFGAKGVIIKETPEVFKEVDVKSFIKDLADNITEYGEALNLEEKFTDIYGNYACHHSIRAGRKLSVAEMNDILRKMEETPFSGQCNHGRPTYVELSKDNLEKLFGRK